MKITSFQHQLNTIITDRELQVLHLIAHEYSSKEIATQLHVSYETASSHRQNLLRKLKVKNTAGLVRVAYELGILVVHENKFLAAS